ncbi:hypothetical protein [Aeromonas phage 59.1]|nr:hypothetical protein [Aeromonas phage 59.1]
MAGMINRRRTIEYRWCVREVFLATGEEVVYSEQSAPRLFGFVWQLSLMIGRRYQLVLVRSAYCIDTDNLMDRQEAELVKGEDGKYTLPDNFEYPCGGLGVKVPGSLKQALKRAQK